MDFYCAKSVICQALHRASVADNWPTGLAFPADLSSSSPRADSSNFLPPNPYSKSVDTRDPIANGAALRVLCLGASIMGGYLSTDKNGMRYALRSALAAHGNKVS